jgi:phenylacetate-CoA ligase
MTAGSSARRAGFWLVDRLRGGPVRRQYDDVSDRMASGRDARDGLQRLIEHATSTTAFYGRYRGKAFEDLPIINSKLVKADRAAFESSSYRGARLHRIETSGSTGVPLTLDQDQTKRARAIADLLYFNDLGGYRVGDRLMWLRSWRYFPKSRLWRAARNIVPVDKVGMDDTVREQVVRTLRSGHVDAVLGAASTLWSLTRFMEARGVDPADYRLKVVISGAETLQPEVRARIERAFGCPVVDRYANEENGVLASSRPGIDGLLLNRASYHFEFLEPERDVPQRAGLPARLVITDLHGSATPLIRYDTGDLAIVDPADGDVARSLISVDGRRIDVLYDSAGGMVSPGTISRYMAERFEVDQFQIVQEGATSFVLRVVLGETVYAAEQFVAALGGILGAAANVRVEFVAAFPSQAGEKFRPVISHYEPGGETLSRPS